MADELSPYYPEDSADMYEEYYAEQIGNGLAVYQGKPLMTGNGIGSVFKGLFRSALPMLKRGAVAAGKKLLTSGAGVLGDVIGGANVKESAKKRFKAAGADLLDDVEQTLRNGGGVRAKRPPFASPPPTRAAKRPKRAKTTRTKKKKTIFS